MSVEITPERLREIAANARINQGPYSLYAEVLEATAFEIEVLRHTAEASVKLAQRASMQSVSDRELMHGMQVEATNLHNKMVAYRANRDELKKNLKKEIAARLESMNGYINIDDIITVIDET